MKGLNLKLVVIVALLFLGNSLVFAKNMPLPVATSKLSELLIRAIGSAPANVISINHTTVSAEITGRVLKVFVETGDFVKKGNILATIDCRSYVLAKKQAEAGLKVAKTQLNYSEKQFKRNQRLLKTGIIASEAFEKAEAGKLTALADIQLKKASIETTNLAISRCQIYAPFSGQVTTRFVQKGQLVTPGTPLFKILQTDKQEIKASLSPIDVAKLDDLFTLDFVIDTARFKVNVRSIVQNIDEVTRTQEVRFTLADDINISAGRSGRIEWSSKERLLPAEYLIRRNSILGIMIAKDIANGLGQASFYQIIDAKEGLPVKINLPDDTLVITKNRHQVKTGQTIKIKNIGRLY